MAANDIYRCEVFMNQGSELTMNVMHMRESVSEADPRLAALAVQEYINGLYLLYAEMMSEKWRVTTVRVRRVSPTGGIPYQTVFGGAEAIVGQLESDPVPPQAGLLVSIYADSNDRAGRGRNYIPGIAESIQSEGQLGEAAYAANHTAIESYLEDEHGPFGGATGKYRFNIWNSPDAGTDSHDVAVAYMHSNLATQRRRRNFPGFAT